MNEYAQVYLTLGLPRQALAFALARIPNPLPTIETPFSQYGFPPALIPIYSNRYPWYVGFWKHWFCDRKPCIVTVVPEEGYAATEEYRTFDQLASHLVLRHIVAEDGVTDETWALAQGLGVVDVPALDAISTVTGDDVQGMSDASAFLNDPPWQCRKDDATYRGAFPQPKQIVAQIGLRNVCGLELTEEQRAHACQLASAPAWLRSRHQRPVFDSLLASGDLAGAWMSLNSPGWEFRAAKHALQALADRTADDAFRVLASAWIAQPHEEAGSY